MLDVVEMPATLEFDTQKSCLSSIRESFFFALFTTLEDDISSPFWGGKLQKDLTKVTLEVS